MVVLVIDLVLAIGLFHVLVIQELVALHNNTLELQNLLLLLGQPTGYLLHGELLVIGRLAILVLVELLLDLLLLLLQLVDLVHLLGLVLLEPVLHVDLLPVDVLVHVEGHVVGRGLGLLLFLRLGLVEHLGGDLEALHLDVLEALFPLPARPLPRLLLLLGLTVEVLEVEREGDLFVLLLGSTLLGLLAALAFTQDVVLLVFLAPLQTVDLHGVQDVLVELGVFLLLAALLHPGLLDGGLLLRLFLLLLLLDHLLYRLDGLQYLLVIG